jgi:hypothetical protein
LPFPLFLSNTLLVFSRSSHSPLQRSKDPKTRGPRQGPNLSGFVYTSFVMVLV